MSSSVHGWTPSRIIPATASPAASMEAKNASSVCFGGGIGIRRSVASVTIPSVPMLPTNRLARS